MGPCPVCSTSLFNASTENLCHDQPLYRSSVQVSYPPCAGGGGGAVYLNRYDLSVNEARVEGAQTVAPYMITGTTLNTAGAFTGGGTGNKAILGCGGHSGMPLGAIASIEWEWDNISPLEPGTLHRYPYVNLVLQLSPGQLKILVIDPNQAVITPALNLGAMLAIGPTSWRFTHTPGVNLVQIVNAFTAQVAAGIVPAMPIVSTAPAGLLPVPVAAGVPAMPQAAPQWNNYSFRYSDILAAFPAATLIDIYTGDGGLPGPSGIATPTPAVMMVVGDSSFRRQRYVQIDKFEINGSPA